MHRQNFLDRLGRYAERHPDEEEAVQRYRAFVEQHPDCFSRSQRSGHVTGSAWLLDPGGTRVLLTHHRKLGIWVQLGGHVDGNPEVLQEALREAREESGIAQIRVLSEDIFDLDIHRIPERPLEPEHWHYDARFLFQAETPEFRVSEESHDLCWVPLENLEDFSREASLLRMLRKTPASAL
ncbi:MAG: NUDIX hydrolase [bacterium]|jgi:8-oxo-dGTP pyrophosphatase MutT (NUDIX family)